MKGKSQRASRSFGALPGTRSFRSPACRSPTRMAWRRPLRHDTNQYQSHSQNTLLERALRKDQMRLTTAKSGVQAPRLPLTFGRFRDSLSLFRFFSSSSPPDNTPRLHFYEANYNGIFISLVRPYDSRAPFQADFSTSCSLDEVTLRVSIPCMIGESNDMSNIQL